MPLIRYKTGDYATYMGFECKNCKRKLPLITDIKGRWEGKKIFGSKDSITTTTALNFHDDLYSYIEGIQYIQKEKGLLEILIIKGKGFLQDHDIRIREHYNSKFSGDMIIKIRYVSELVRNSNGKFVELISEIK